MVTIGGVGYFHYYSFGWTLLILGLISVITVLILWWRDVIREATYIGNHTEKVQLGLRFGMILFIVSEVMFFLAFFWAFFHSSLAPSVELGSLWPPRGIHPFNPFKVPLLNTIILLASGATITLAHNALLINDRKTTIIAFISTVILALLFTSLQVLEYVEAPFTIADSVYGSTFFMATGFHGFHVIIGTTFIVVCFIRFLGHQFSEKHHFGFEAAAWYWHFVDVVWLFLFITIYFWGGYRHLDY
jgi:cytochrome c oxidase subunit 3